MRHPAPAFSVCAAVLAIAAAPLGAMAQDAPPPLEAETVWHCWYNQDSTFRCRLARARADVADEGVPTPPAARPSLYPRRGRLPEIVRTIHEHPARLRGRTITIPLFSPPLDRRFAALLVQSVMCGIQPACETRIYRSANAAARAYEEDPAREE